jgi:hypothetical protein
MRQITRSQAINEIRGELMKLVDDEHSICEVAARHNIFCGGFAQWTFYELKKLYPQIVSSRPGVTPHEMRDLANRWQLARQFVTDTAIACDVQLHEKDHQTCHGWNDFTDAELAGFHATLCHADVAIIPEPAAPRTKAT